MIKRILLIFLVLALFVVVRVVPTYLDQSSAEIFANISPLAALALCGGMMLPSRTAFILTFGTFSISDIMLNLKYGQPIINYYSLFLLVFLAAIFTCGYLLRKHRKISVLLVSTIASSFLFYLLLNSVSFFMDPHYTKNITGWFQANTTGVPGYPPAWLFGLRMLMGNSIFALVFYFALSPKSDTLVEAPHLSQTT
ncbi:MAG: DUF6580 family putative transport protein [Verrucomicrobiales bacterium]